MVLQYDSVVDDRHGRVGTVAAVVLEGGGGVDDVVHVPLTRLAHRVGEGDRLLVDATCLPVHVGRVVVAVEYLHLIQALQEDTTVAARLALARDVGGHLPFDM